jgi:hypothetical protein
MLVQNPSFIGADGDQFDVVFYPSKKFYTGNTSRRSPMVSISKDSAIQTVLISPADVPSLIDALKQVHQQYLDGMVTKVPDCDMTPAADE